MYIHNCVLHSRVMATGFLGYGDGSPVVIADCIIHSCVHTFFSIYIIIYIYILFIIVYVANSGVKCNIKQILESKKTKALTEKQSSVTYHLYECLEAEQSTLRNKKRQEAKPVCERSWVVAKESRIAIESKDVVVKELRS